MPRTYSAADEETLHARGLMKDWAGEGFLTPQQYSRMEQETVSQLRRTNIFLRLVLFLFTLLIVGAAAALFFQVVLSSPGARTTGFFLLIFSAATYAAAEAAVSRLHLHRYGIEEALAACSVGFLCAGIEGAFFSASSSARLGGLEFVVPAAGVLASLWIWSRFGLLYAPLAAMIFALWLPDYWTSSPAARHAMVGALYGAGLAVVIAVRPRYRFTFRNLPYSLLEAFLWLGIYAVLNLQLSSLNLMGQWWNGGGSNGEFPSTFYWGTWALTWCWPPLVLVRGLREKDRCVIAAGATAAILTLITNKAYLGWPRHTWDPILLGALLIGIALFLRRWLAAGPEGVRRGFTARRLSGKDKAWLNAGSAAVGLISPSSSPSSGSDVRFGGGDSGGGGATSDF